MTHRAARALRMLFGDEPVFVLRAQDNLALPTLEQYEGFAEDNGCDPSFLEDLRQVKNRFEDWRIKNTAKIKNPD